MSKHTCGYFLQLRLIHDILQQAAEGAPCLCEICNWFKRGRKWGVCVLWRQTDRKQTDRRTPVTTHKRLSVDVDNRYGLFHSAPVFEASDCGPGLPSFKRIPQHLKMRETNLEESLTLHYAEAFNKRQSQHSLTGPPRCSTYLWWITADSHNLFSHLPLQERKELELVTHCVKKSFLPTFVMFSTELINADWYPRLIA